MGELTHDGIDIVVNSEVGSKAEYIRKYQRPTFPGGRSGITIMLGYDVGAGCTSVAELRHDLEGHVSDEMIKALEPAVGVTGDAARRLLPSIRTKVLIDWDTAMYVFMHVDVPKWLHVLEHSLPNFDLLAPNCKDAMFSLAYNRGAGGFHSSTPRNVEMNNIRRFMETKEFARIPAEIRKMKRLWGQDQRGLLVRRDAEARLFEVGLAAMNAAPAQPAPASVPADASAMADTTLHMGSKGPAVHDLQDALADRNYHVKVEPPETATFGNFTRDAVLAWQADNGRPIKPEMTADDVAALRESPARPVPEARATATIADLKGESTIVDGAEKIKKAALVGGPALAAVDSATDDKGTATVAPTIDVPVHAAPVDVPVPDANAVIPDHLPSIDTAGILDKVSGAADQAQHAKDVFGQVRDILHGSGVVDALAFVGHYKFAIIIVGAAIIWGIARYIQTQRVKMHNSGEAI